MLKTIFIIICFKNISSKFFIVLVIIELRIVSQNRCTVRYEYIRTISPIHNK